MAGVRAKALPSGKFQGWYTNAAGKTIFFVGADTKTETRTMAEGLEHKHRRVALGVDAAPTAAEHAKTRPIAEVMADYVAWGTAQGGIRGRPWATEHAEKRAWGLEWWREELGLETLADVYGVLPRVEAALRTLLSKDKSNLTIRHRAACMTAFIKWCEMRGLVTGDPLKGLVSFPKETRKMRRALTAAEVARLLDTCTPERRLLYEVALSSGLRANELRSLTGADLDEKRGGLMLRAEWTKNRKSGFQPLPAFVLARLLDVGKTKEPTAPLLAVGEHTARDLRSDFKRAGMNEKGQGPGGVVDFHALRVAYTTFVIESGANVKEAQALARHSTPELTMNVYARARNDRLSEVAEAVGRAALPLPVVAEAVALKTGTDDAAIVGEKSAKIVRSLHAEDVRNCKASEGQSLREVDGSPMHSRHIEVTIGEFSEKGLGKGPFFCQNIWRCKGSNNVCGVSP